MSKSLNNTIPIFGEKNELEKIIKGIKTDSTPFGDPLNYNTCSVFKLIELFAHNSEIDLIRENYNTGICQISKKPFGYGAAKNILLNLILKYFENAKYNYDELYEIKRYMKYSEIIGRRLVHNKIKEYKSICGLC